MNRLEASVIDRVPFDELLSAVDSAFRGPAAGTIDNPPREESLGRPGDPDFFSLHRYASLRDAGGRQVFSAHKRIEECGAVDSAVTRLTGLAALDLMIGLAVRPAADGPELPKG